MARDKLLFATLALGAFAAAIPAAAARETGEAQLAKILDGRVAGEPVRCLSSFQRDHMQVIDHTALVFRDGDTIYVNRPSAVNFLTWTDVPVFEVWGDQLCSMDMVHLHDRSTGMQGATMSMGQFIPYRRAG